MDTSIKIDWAGWLQRWIEDTGWPAMMHSFMHWVYFYQLFDSDLGAEIKIMDVFISAYCLKNEVWGFQSYGFSLGLLASCGIFFCLVTKIFFLLVHLKYHLTPLPIKKVDYPYKRGQNWGSYVHNSLPRFNWEYRSCFHTWKRLVCPALCILAPLLTQVKSSLSTNSSSSLY